MHFHAGNMEAERRAYPTVPTFSSNIDGKEVRSMSLKLNYKASLRLDDKSLRMTVSRFLTSFLFVKAETVRVIMAAHPKQVIVQADILAAEDTVHGPTGTFT